LKRLNVRLREFLGYDYKDPAAWLRTLRELNPLIARSGLPYEVRSLRKRSVRRWGEIRQAALFAYGMSQRMPDCRFDFARPENANLDYDAVIRWQQADERYFTPLQLKEFVPRDVNDTATLDEIFEGLTRYRDSSDVTVAIFLNRRFTLEQISWPRLSLGGLYLFGATSPDQSQWFLIGDLLSESASISTFSCPR
jgi:hypothetical protein